MISKHSVVVILIKLKLEIFAVRLLFRLISSDLALSRALYDVTRDTFSCLHGDRTAFLRNRGQGSLNLTFSLLRSNSFLRYIGLLYSAINVVSRGEKGQRCRVIKCINPPKIAAKALFNTFQVWSIGEFFTENQKIPSVSSTRHSWAFSEAVSIEDQPLSNYAGVLIVWSCEKPIKILLVLTLCLCKESKSVSLLLFLRLSVRHLFFQALATGVTLWNANPSKMTTLPN